MSETKIVDIVPKQIWATIEFSELGIRGILDCLEKSMPLYYKVYGDQGNVESESVTEDFMKQLKSIKEEIEKGTER